MIRNNKKIIRLWLLIIIILCIFTWYLVPVKKNITTSLCSIDGEQINVTFNVSWHRYIASPTELKGTITINESIYYSLNDTNFAIERGSLLDRLAKKIKNDNPTPWFIIPTNNVFDIHYNSVQLLHVSMNFDTICMLIVREGSSNTYYGPAETKTEASIISSRLVN